MTSEAQESPHDLGMRALKLDVQQVIVHPQRAWGNKELVLGRQVPRTDSALEK